MKFPSCFIIVLLSCCLASGQKKELPLTLEYSPSLMIYHFSKNGWDDWRPVHGAFAKTEFYLNKRINFMLGLGFFNIRSVRTVYVGDFSFGTHTHIFHNFLSMPLGVKYKMNSIHWCMELAPAYNIGHPTKHKTFLNGEIIKTSRGENIDYKHINKAIVPLYLSITKEIPWNNKYILIGLNSFLTVHSVSTNGPISQVYYGFGLHTGLKWGEAEASTKSLEKIIKVRLQKKIMLHDTLVRFSIEYYPHRTATVTGNYNTDTHEWSQNGFIKVELPLQKQLKATTGVGLITTHDRDHRNGNMPNVVSITTRWTHYYATIPAGIRYQLRRFSINPEVALAYNFDNSNKQYWSDTTGLVRLAEADQFPIGAELKRFAVPAILTLGYEIPFGKTKIILGFKGYYNLTNFSIGPAITKHFYGAGIITGIKF